MTMHPQLNFVESLRRLQRFRRVKQTTGCPTPPRDLLRSLLPTPMWWPRCFGSSLIRLHRMLPISSRVLPQCSVTLPSRASSTALLLHPPLHRPSTPLQEYRACPRNSRCHPPTCPCGVTTSLRLLLRRVEPGKVRNNLGARESCVTWGSQRSDLRIRFEQSLDQRCFEPRQEHLRGQEDSTRAITQSPCRLIQTQRKHPLVPTLNQHTLLNSTRVARHMVMRPRRDRLWMPVMLYQQQDVMIW